MIWCMHKPKVGFSPFFVAANALFCSDGFHVVPSFPQRSARLASPLLAESPRLLRVNVTCDRRA